MNQIQTGSLYMVLSAVMLSVVGMLGKLGGEHLSLILLIFFRFGIALILFLPFLWWKGGFSKLFHINNFKLQLARCALVLISQYALFYYLDYSSLLSATVLQNFSPLLIPVLDALFFKHKIKPILWVWAAISFIGMFCVLQPEKGFLGEVGLVGLLIPLGQAGSQLLYGQQAHKEKNEVSLFYLLMLSTLVSGVVYLFFLPFKESSSLIKPEGWLPLISTIIALGLATILNQYLRGIAYKHAKPSHLAPLLYTALLFSAGLDFAFFNRIPNLLSLFGAALVVVGGWLSIYTLRNKTPEIP